MRVRTASLALGLCVAAGVASQPVPFEVTTKTTTFAGMREKVDVYRPVDDAAGITVLAHGFSRDRTRARDLGRDLAGAGVVAVAPDFPNVVDYGASGEALADLVRDLERGALGLPPTPRSRIVLIGTSAGGVATVIAASQLPGIAGWIGLDPVDRSGIATDAVAKLTAPALILLGEPSVCNLFGSGRSIAQAAPTLVRSERVRGASHCDFEGPTNNFCRTVCGKSTRGMDQRVRGEAVAATLDMLHGRCSRRGPRPRARRRARRYGTGRGAH